MSDEYHIKPKDKSTYLYRHFSGEGDLLYVGISCNALKRLNAHRVASPWFGDIASVQIQKFSTREEALTAEREAISSEKPKHNVTWSQNEIMAGAAEKSRMAMVLNVRPLYSMTGLAEELSVSVGEVKRLIEEKKLNYIVLSTFMSHGRLCERRRVTGFQLIDFLEEAART